MTSSGTASLRTLLAASLLLAATAGAAAPAGPPAGDAPALRPQRSAAASAAAERWHALLAGGQDDAARAECLALATSDDLSVATEGEACLANVELRAAGGLDLRAVSEGRPPAGQPDAASIDRALAHLQRALTLSPADLPLHQARFDVLLASGRFADLPRALEQSLALHPGDALDQWLGVSADLFAAGAAPEALAAARLLEGRWPDDHRVVGNVGSLLSVLERDDEALAALQRAVALAPTDPVDRWNLSRLLEFMGRDDEAAASYARWSELETDTARRQRNSCVFAAFVEQRRRDLPRACRLQEEFCPPESRTACQALKGIPAASEAAPPRQSP